MNAAADAAAGAVGAQAVDAEGRDEVDLGQELVLVILEPDFLDLGLLDGGGVIDTVLEGIRQQRFRGPAPGRGKIRGAGGEEGAPIVLLDAAIR